MKITKRKLRQYIHESYRKDSAIKRYLRENYDIHSMFKSLSNYYGTGDFFNAAYQKASIIATEIDEKGVFPYTNRSYIINLINKTLLIDLFSLHRQWLSNQEY